MKYFAIDVDGTTLAPGEKKFSPNIVNGFNKVLEHNKLIVASGRTYYNLRKLFNQNDDVIYLCENGSLLMMNKKPVIIEKIKKSDAKVLIKEILNYEDLNIEICTGHKVYVQNRNDKYVNWMSILLSNPVVPFNDVEEIKEPIIKVSYYKIEKDERFDLLASRFKKQFKGIFQVFDANNNWIDFSPLGVDKGSTIKKFLQLQGSSVRSLYTFGDGENDITMFKLNKNSYCKDTGLEVAKKHANYIFSDFNETVTSIIDGTK